MSNENWYNINFSVDLVEATINQLAFLKQVDRIGHLYKGYYFEQALLRYELIWLPLKAENNNVNLVPPIDVQWIWHLHMLSSVSYLKDCQNICCKVLNHRVLTEKEREKYAKSSKET